MYFDHLWGLELGTFHLLPSQSFTLLLHTDSEALTVMVGMVVCSTAHTMNTFIGTLLLPKYQYPTTNT
jgi:hypothetical protein